MDDFRQSAAPVARRRRAASGPRLLGLLAVLALLLLLPGRALADRADGALWQPVDVSAALVQDAQSVDDPPAEDAPPVAETTPTEPAPVDPPPAEPAPTEPAPTEPAPPAEPAPTEPAPPAEPTPTEPAPAPTDPLPPADEVPPPADPAPVDPVPTDPAPRDGRATTPRPPSEERQLSDESTPAPVTSTAVTPVTAPAPADADAATTRTATPADEDANQAKTVRAAFKQLGLGTIAAPDDGGPTAPIADALAQACTPLGTVAVSAAPQVGGVLATPTAVRAHWTDDDPPAARGPPAPLDGPSSPMAAAAGGTAAPGGFSGDRDCAVLSDAIAFQLADGGCTVVTDCRAHVAPAPANTAARAPPVS